MPPKKHKVVCPICDDPIEDAVGSKKGQDTILCDGPCKSWLHRRCAGLSKAAFNSISKSPEAFFCPICRLERNEREVKLLKDRVSQLEDKLQSVLSLAESNSSNKNNQHKVAISSVNNHYRLTSHLHDDLAHKKDQRFNVVIYGIQECKQGTSRLARYEEDLKGIISTISSRQYDRQQFSERSLSSW